MNREDAIITLTNTASLLRDGTRYMKPEHEKQFREAYEMAIKALEQPEQQWIPVTKRLPDNYTDVLVWFEYFRYGDYNCLYQTYGIGSYSTKYDSWMINHETGWRKLRVLAWMPLPEPYGGEQDG